MQLEFIEPIKVILGILFNIVVLSVGLVWFLLSQYYLFCCNLQRKEDELSQSLPSGKVIWLGQGLSDSGKVSRKKGLGYFMKFAILLSSFFFSVHILNLDI